jgi:DNA polymerase II small subunit
MEGKEKLKKLSAALSQARILLAADIEESLISNANINSIVTELVESHKNDVGVSIASKEELSLIISGLSKEKNPKLVEVSHKSEYSPIASEVESRYVINKRDGDISEGNASAFVEYFNDRLHRIKEIISYRRPNFFIAPSISSTKAYTSGREVIIAGMVSSKIITKKGNLMVIIEDDTGEMRVVFVNGSSYSSKQLFESAKRIINDEVIAIKGKLSNQFLIPSEIVWPDVPVIEPKSTEEDIAIAFLSDIHVGSKQFLEKNFSKMLRWINGEAGGTKDGLAGKIKYIVIAGDVADGVGIYPDQEYELAIPDIYLQYKQLFSFLETIPDYIEVFMMPGNHDAVGRAEPQHNIDEELYKDFKIPNLHLVSNPCYINLHGLEVLSYHGTSLDSIIRAIPGMSYASPEKAMVELLKRRHLSPVYGGNVIIPTKKDQLVIDRMPDIMHMGHIHKNGIANYHGIKIINSGTWQGTTKLQQRSGHVPTPAIMPVLEAKTGNISSLNFNDI